MTFIPLPAPCLDFFAVTDWLTDNTTDILRVLKSRIPSARFLRAQDSQENLQGAPEASVAALESCAVEIEAQLNRIWTEEDQEERTAAKGRAGGPLEGPPGRLWGLTLSGGATTALFSASNMSVLFKETSPIDGDQEVSAGGPQKWQQEAPAVQQGGEGVPLGWISAECEGAMTLGAARNISGETGIYKNLCKEMEINECCKGLHSRAPLFQICKRIVVFSSFDGFVVHYAAVYTHHSMPFAHKWNALSHF